MLSSIFSFSPSPSFCTALARANLLPNLKSLKAFLRYTETQAGGLRKLWAAPLGVELQERKSYCALIDVRRYPSYSIMFPPASETCLPTGRQACLCRLTFSLKKLGESEFSVFCFFFLTKKSPLI